MLANNLKKKGKDTTYLKSNNDNQNDEISLKSISNENLNDSSYNQQILNDSSNLKDSSQKLNMYESNKFNNVKVENLTYDQSVSINNEYGNHMPNEESNYVQMDDEEKENIDLNKIQVSLNGKSKFFIEKKIYFLPFTVLAIFKLKWGIILVNDC